VVFLEGGRVRGGDSRIFYTGTYSENGGQFTAQIETDLHTNAPGMSSVLGRDRAHITLKGTTSGDSGQMTGTAIEAPGVVFQAVLTRIGN